MKRVSGMYPLQNKEAYNVLQYIYSTIEKVGGHPFLVAGTCLGAFRNHDFIPHDLDIDIGILYEEFKTIYEQVKIELQSKGYKVKEVKYPFTYVKALKIDNPERTIHIDFVGWFKYQDKRYTASTNKNWCHVHDAKLFEGKLHLLPIGNHMYAVPTPVEKYLERNFGIDYKIPKQEGQYKRLSRVGNYLNIIGVKNKWKS